MFVFFVSFLTLGSCCISNDDTLPEKLSKFSLPRLHSSSLRKSSSTASNRPTTAHGSPQKSPNDFTRMFDEKSPATLRKRTISNPNIAISANANAIGPEPVNGGVIKEGVNIVDRIGEPDHTGWMRKKADRYNSWKTRYFILKGPHLYILGSNSKSVSCAPALIFFLIE